MCFGQTIIKGDPLIGLITLLLTVKSVSYHAWCPALHVPCTSCQVCAPQWSTLPAQPQAKSLESDRPVLLHSSWQAETETDLRASMAEFTWPASRFRNQFYTLFNRLSQWTWALLSEIEQIGWLCSSRPMLSAATQLNERPRILNCTDSSVLMVTIMCNPSRN